jgi:hypothetical protein
MSYWGGLLAHSFIFFGFFINMAFTNKNEKSKPPALKSKTSANKYENWDHVTEKFMAMFVGFVDGDGYIEIGPQKQYGKTEATRRATIKARLTIRVEASDLPV